MIRANKGICATAFFLHKAVCPDACTHSLELLSPRIFVAQVEPHLRPSRCARSFPGLALGSHDPQKSTPAGRYAPSRLQKWSGLYMPWRPCRLGRRLPGCHLMWPSLEYEIRMPCGQSLRAYRLGTIMLLSCRPSPGPFRMTRELACLLDD